MNKWIEPLASIATFITALATFFTIIEMKRQRRSSFTPVFSFEDTTIRAWMLPDSGVEITHADQDLPTDGSHVRIAMDGYNIGNGAARNIEVRWELNTEEIIALLMRLDVDGKYRFEVGDKLLRVSSNSGKLNVAYSITKLQQELPHLSTVATGAKPMRLFVPTVFTDLCGMYFQFFLQHMRESSPETFESDEWPKLRFHLKYADLDDTETIRTFGVRMALSYARSVLPGEDPVSFANAVFEVSEINKLL